MSTRRNRERLEQGPDPTINTSNRAASRGMKDPDDSHDHLIDPELVIHVAMYRQ
jgi:hypothetical protein